MYSCPKCGGLGKKERIKVPTYSEEFIVKSGDIQCQQCGYIGTKKEFGKEEK